MLFGKSKGPRARRPRWFNQARLAVEALEDRYLLATCLWSGAGMDANWSNPSNWGGTAPVAGDNLVFAAGASQLASYNDFAAGTSFGSITFQAGGYSVSGNAVVLTAGISATNPTGADALNLDVTLGASQSFAPANAGTALNLGGAVNLNGFTLTLDGAGSTSLTGGTSGTGGLVKNGTGTLTLAGNNPCSAPVTLNAGTLLANGSQAAGAVTVNAGGTLGGTGTLGAVTVAGGGVDPGAPGGTALLSATGNVAFGIGSTCSVQLNGALAGTGYDQLSVNGTVNLGGSTLNASLGYAPNPGDSYTIIHSSRGITGTFNNLPNGAVLSVGGKTFQISYTATDVVLTQVQAGTTTTVTSSLTPSTAGQAVTFTATVSAGQGMGTPTGMVTFVIDGIAQPGVALVNGQAAFTTSALTAGSHTIIASYGGGATFSGSTSAALNQMVNPAATTTALSSSAGSSVYGQAVTFTATVSSAGAGTPVGMVTFLDGTTVLGTALLSGGSASFTTSSLAVGEHWITAVYGGGNFLGSTSAALCQAVNSTGNAWQHQQVVTLSFVPDGTDLGGYQSNLFATFNSMFGSPTVWQDQILKAAQQWAQQANINLAVVNDNGAPMGSGGYQQGDPGFGDIRIGGYNFGTTTLAQAYMPPPVNNYSIAGDIQFNTGRTWNVGSTYDLYTVAMHEIGHALGLYHIMISGAVMYPSYEGVKAGLTLSDISAIDGVYGSRIQDVYDTYSPNNSFATATNVTSLIDPSTLTALVNNVDLTTTTDADYYTFLAPSAASGTLTVTVQSQGLSLLSPQFTVYAADQTTVLGSASGAGQYGATLAVTLNGVTAGQRFYVKVTGAETGTGAWQAFNTGAYAMTLDFGPNPPPVVTPPPTQTPNGNPLQSSSPQPLMTGLQTLAAGGLSGLVATGDEDGDLGAPGCEYRCGYGVDAAFLAAQDHQAVSPAAADPAFAPSAAPETSAAAPAPAFGPALAALLTGLTAPTAGATSAPAGGLSVLPDGDPLPPAALASGEAFAVLLAPAPGGVGEALTRSAGSVAPAGPACDACFADTGWLEDALAALG